MGDGDVNSNLLIARSTGDAQLDKAVAQWLSWDKVLNTAIFGVCEILKNPSGKGFTVV